MEIFRVENLSFSYPEQETKALDDFSLTVQEGEFLVICGPSGCGKSTLLRLLKPLLAPHGTLNGTVKYRGAELSVLDQRTQAQEIGFVQQDPENQIVTDKVWHELAFGMESLGFDTPTIRHRVAEMASFFGIEDWFYKNVSELSGGQKQLLNLASVMTLQPFVLILDEPTSQLDPIAASEFLAALGKINRELGTTVILTEHRLEDVLPMATRVAVMEQGKLLCAGTAGKVGEILKNTNNSMFFAMPAAMRIWAATEDAAPCPVTVREGRTWLTAYAATHPLRDLPREAEYACFEESAITAEGLWFRYEKDAPDVVNGLDLQVKKGEFAALLGGNGTGKSTTLKLIAGLRKPYRGTLQVHGRIGVLPQNPQTLFVKKTVREDLHELLCGQEDAEGKVINIAHLCRLDGLLDRHPYDLSGGEQQRAALAKVLLTDPEILLLDEPTKGLDAAFKREFALILQALLSKGVTVLMVSHDVEFCAQYAHRCALLFDGTVVTEGTPRAFFSGNSFYTTSANRMARGLLPQAVTAEDVIFACGGEMPQAPQKPQEEIALPRQAEKKPAKQAEKLPWWRKLLALCSGAAAMAMMLRVLSTTDLSSYVETGGTTPMATSQLLLYGGLLLSLFVFAFSVSRRAERPYTLSKRKKLNKRTLVATVLILLLIPLTLLLGERFLGGRKYYFISLLILLECMIPFFLIFESRKPQARELVIVAVLCAIGVAGRAVFFMLPQFKPVIAIAVIAGVAFGGETGFLVGAVTMLVSNLMFSQGPWTPWQMFCTGIIGFLAGVLFDKGLLRRSRLSLCIFGALTTVLIYGGVMNPASAIMWTGELRWEVFAAYYVTGLPMDCVHAAATWLFLWFAAEPMLEKLDRIKVKYGLIE